MADSTPAISIWGNLLTEALLPLRYGGSEHLRTLPGVLHALSSEDVEGFPGLRRHQRQPWYSFLVQLAVIAAEKQSWSGERALAASEDEWRGALRALTGERDEAWSLVVADLAQPAFLQAPVPVSSREGWSYQRNADALDLLQVAKRHDLKGDVLQKPSAAHWAWTLVSVQTFDGAHGGRDKASIVRMNSTIGSRALVSLGPSIKWSGRVRRDLATLLGLGDRLYELGPAKGSLALVWLKPWGEHDVPLQIERLHPLFLEACRPIRLTHEGSAVVVGIRTPKEPRIGGKEFKGNVGDPWIPIDKKDGKALTISVAGFTYDKVAELLLSGDWRQGGASRRSRGDSGVLFQAMARGQGKTQGLHERWVDVPPQVFSRIESEHEAAQVRLVASNHSADVATMWKVLRQALLLLQQAAPNNPDWKSKAADCWRPAFTAAVDDVFFRELWSALDTDDEEARGQWRAHLLRTARDVLATAIDATPLPGIRRYHAISAAEARLTAWPQGK